jgi:hypothetical protein
MSISGIGSSYASPLPHELFPADASVAEPAPSDGTSGLFSTGMPFDIPTAGVTIDGGAALLALLLQQADKANDGANQIKAALASIFTALGAISGSAARRAELTAANAELGLEIAGFTHQRDQKTVDLAVAQAKLAEDQKLDPRNPDLEAEDTASIATINASIADLSQSIAQRETQSSSNNAQIAGLQSSFLSGFNLIARFIGQRLSEQQRNEVARSETVDATFQEIYDGLHGFLNDAQVAEVLRLVQQQQADEFDVDARTVAAGVTDQATNTRQIQDSAGAQPPLDILAIPGAISPAGPDRAAAPPLLAASTAVPTQDAPRSAQAPTPVRAPADDPSAQDDERERNIDADEGPSRRQQDQITRTAIAVEPPPRQDPSQEQPSQKVTRDSAAIVANPADQRATLQTTIARDTLARDTSDGISDAAASDTRLQHSDLFAEVTRKADDLATRLDGLVQRFVKSDAPLADSLTVASLQGQENPGRWRLPV